MVRRFPLLFVVVSAALLDAGCKAAHIPNPNDPVDVGPLSPATVRRNLGAVTDSLQQRLLNGEIDRTKYRELVEKAAGEIVEEADSSDIPPAQAWEYGEVLRDAHQWKLAEPVLRTAVEYAKKTKNEDRRVNDSLRLATVLAREGKVDEAIKTAHSAFDAPPEDTAPILLGTYLELVPVARGKGHDLELGHLVEEAIGIHLRTKVDPATDSGRGFIAAKPYHVRKAWELAADLYAAAGRNELARHARDEAAMPIS
jgi:hypothetical protein